MRNIFPWSGAHVAPFAPIIGLLGSENDTFVTGWIRLHRKASAISCARQLMADDLLPDRCEEYKKERQLLTRMAELKVADRKGERERGGKTWKKEEEEEEEEKST